MQEVSEVLVPLCCVQSTSDLLFGRVVLPETGLLPLPASTFKRIGPFGATDVVATMCRFVALLGHHDRDGLCLRLHWLARTTTLQCPFLPLGHHFTTWHLGPASPSRRPCGVSRRGS